MKTLPALALSLSAATLALADMRFTEKSQDTYTTVLKDGETRSPRDTIALLKGRLLKFVESDDPKAKPKREVVFDLDKVLQVDVSPRTKTFKETGAEALKAKVEAAKKRMEDVEKRLPTFSGERKARCERYVFLVKKMLGALAEAPKVELKRTGEKQKFGEWECERVTIQEANHKGEMETVFDCWMTDKAEGWSAYAEMYGHYKALSPGVLEKMKELKGFHVKGEFTVFWMEGDGMLQRTIFDNSDAKPEAIADAEFQIPADFKNVDKK